MLLNAGIVHIYVHIYTHTYTYLLNCPSCVACCPLLLVVLCVGILRPVRGPAGMDAHRTMSYGVYDWLSNEITGQYYQNALANTTLGHTLCVLHLRYTSIPM